jgi:hypothetical protein
MAKAFDELGHTMIIPSKDYNIQHRPKPPIKDFVWNESWSQEKVDQDFIPSNVRCLNKEEILEIKPEIIFITAYENQFEILNEIWPHLQHCSKLAFYSGNDYWAEAYPWYLVQNYLCADYLAFTLCQKHGINHLYYRPWVDYDSFSFGGPTECNKINSYINDYEGNFPKEYEFSQALKEAVDFIDFEFCEGLEKKNVVKKMHDSLATLHVKNLEGYGYTIIESMACGRPVFLSSALSKNKSYENWAVENKTCLYFEDSRDFACKAKALIDSKDYREYLQGKCAATIRELINNEEQTNKLGTFLNRLV